jgi:hypothetical protein
MYKYPEENFNSIREECGPHFSKRTEFIQRKFDKKWVRWELVNPQIESSEGERPFESATNARSVWVATGVWHEKPVVVMGKEKQRWKEKQKVER